MTTEDLITSYYAAFNAADYDGMVALLTDDVAHDVNQGERAIGRAAFRSFLSHMERCYSEQLSAIVVLTEPTGRRAAAEFIVHGVYKATDTELPEATGQTYVLPAGAFFEIRAGLISRVSNFYNLPDWLRQVGA
jgi:steroid delta-isomerase-like uncharacterized protein